MSVCIFLTVETDELMTRVDSTQVLLGDTPSLRSGIAMSPGRKLPGELSSHASATNSTPFFLCERVSASMTSGVTQRSDMAPSVSEAHTASERQRASIPLDDQRSLILLCVSKDQEKLSDEHRKSVELTQAHNARYQKYERLCGQLLPTSMSAPETSLDALYKTDITHLYSLLAKESLNVSKNVSLGDPLSWCKLY